MTIAQVFTAPVRHRRFRIPNLLAGVIAVIALTAGVLGGAAPLLAKEGAQNQPLRVVTTLFPLYDWARVIAQDRATVSLLLPPGVEPHSFEPTPKDITAINKADLLIYTGEFMEPWVESLIKGKTNKNLIVVDASQGLELMAASQEEDGDHEHADHEHGHGNSKTHHHQGKDPHIWLEFGNAQKIVDHIASAFAAKDPDNAQVYLNRAQDYNAKLQELDETYARTLAACKHRTLIYGGHFAFGYFANRYRLKHMSPYQGFAPDAEPTPKKLAELIKTMKESDLQAIFYEEGIEPRVAKVIGEETGARLLLLHGAHNVTKDELAGGVTYLSIMQANLERLKQGLECP